MQTDQIQLLYGQVSGLSADLYLRLPKTAADWKDADVKGPYCSNGRTLPTTARFEPQPQENLWRARIIDPVFWSSDHPALYRVRIDRVGDHQACETIELECGLRRFGCKNGNLWFDGKRWVMRGAWRHHVCETELVAWREARMAMWVQRPETSLLTEAARQGALLAVQIDQDATFDNLVTVTQCPAVVLVVVHHAATVDQWRSLLPNTVFVKRYDPRTMDTPPHDADAILLQVADQVPPNLQAFGGRPVLALRELSDPVAISTARAGCDQLQRDLAERFDLSGYIV